MKINGTEFVVNICVSVLEPQHSFNLRRPNLKNNIVVIAVVVVLSRSVTLLLLNVLVDLLIDLLGGLHTQMARPRLGWYRENT